MKFNQNKLLILFISILLFISIGSLLISKNIIPSPFSKQQETSANQLPDGKKMLKIGEKEIIVEIADTEEKRNLGLSGRESLAENTGMLFNFPEPQIVVFWMPDMNFPIDMLFIKDNTVVFMHENVPNPPKDTPKEKLPRYMPDQPVDMVLEVPAGFASANGIARGEKITLKP